MQERFLDVSHEALIRGWPRLRRWLDEDRAGLRLLRRITEAAEEWHRSNRDNDLLFRGARLIQAQEWRERHEAELNPLEREFLDASTALKQRVEERERQQQQRELEAAQKLASEQKKRADDQAKATARQRKLTIAVGIVSVVAAVTGVISWTASRKANINERKAFAATSKGATNTYNEIIDAISKRHYYALRAAIGFQWHDDETGHWQEYENMRRYWNEHRHSIYALTERYFGGTTQQRLKAFLPKFDYVDDKLVAAQIAFRDKKPMPEDFSKKDGLLDYLYNMDYEIRKFSESLQEQIKRGQIDIYASQPPLKKP
jgi:hypothetical protein